MKAFYAEQGSLVQRDVPEPAPGPGQMLIAVKAAGLNAADAMILHGSGASGAASPMGAEAAGEVLALGEGVEQFAVGDRVMSQCGGAFAPFAIFRAALAMHVPDRLSWAEAAAVPVVFATAHDALLAAGHFTAGDHVLVNAAPSGVGVATLQLARLFGAGVIAASSRSQEKLDQLSGAGIPFDVGLVAADPDFVELARNASEKHGFDVIVDNVGAGALHDNIAVAAVLGRIVQVGRMGGHVDEVNLDELARKRLSIVGVTFRTRSPEETAEVYSRAAADVVPALADGRLRVVVDRVFPFGDAPVAEDWMKTGRQIGKVILHIDD